VEFEIMNPDNSWVDSVTELGSKVWDNTVKTLNLEGYNDACEGGTPYGVCSTNKPYFCNLFGDLVAQCTTCGCPSPEWNPKPGFWTYWCCNADTGGCVKSYNACSNVNPR